MSNANDITGDAMISKSTSDAYRSGWDLIFNKKEPKTIEEDLIKVEIKDFDDDILLSYI